MGKPYKIAASGLWAQAIELPPKPDGKRRRKVVTATTRAGLAPKVRAALQEKARMGDLATNSPTVGRWLDTWMREIVRPHKRPRTIENYAHMVSLITPPIGKVRLDKLTASHVRRVHAYVMTERGLSNNTARNAHAVLRKALSDAEAEGLVPRNVAKLVEAPPMPRTTIAFLDADQAVALLRSVARDERAAIRWALALIMGLRRGEALGLRADHVDLDEGTITVEWQLQRPDTAPRRDERFIALENGYYLTEVKTEAGLRVLPLDPGLAEMMRRHVPTLPGPDSFVCGPGIVSERQDYDAWNRALRDAGLPKVKPHSARHSALTLLARLGAPDYVRTAVAGHASKRVTAIYTHAQLDEVRSWTARAGAALALESAATD